MLRGRAIAWALVGGAIAWPADAGEKKDISITGKIAVTADLAGEIGAADRLVIKMYHPDKGVEKDLKYWILDDFALPQDFRVAPTVNMTGMARWKSYVIEVYTDRDRNVLNLIDGELWATTGALVRLGSGGLELVLGRPPAD